MQCIAMQTWRINIKKSKVVFMGKQIMYLAIAVVVMIGVMAAVFGTSSQQNTAEGLELSQAAKQGSFASPSGLGADLNKEQWNADPFADEAAAVRAAYNNDG
jgi:hypothetical protein